MSSSKVVIIAFYNYFQASSFTCYPNYYIMKHLYTTVPGEENIQYMSKYTYVPLYWIWTIHMGLKKAGFLEVENRRLLKVSCVLNTFSKLPHSVDGGRILRNSGAT